jgi:hypothetical protein
MICAALKEIVGHFLRRVFPIVVSSKSPNLDVTDEPLWCFMLSLEVLEAAKYAAFVLD